jgi:hypothetical protein
MVLVIAQWEAGQSEWRLNLRATFYEDIQVRVGKQLWTADKSNRK